MKRFKGRKFQQKRKLNPAYSIIVDGETEVWYLQLLKDFENIREIKIVPELPNKKTLEEQHEYVIERFDSYEKVIWIVDMDVIIKEGKEKADRNTQLVKFWKMKAEIEKKNGIVIVNTPCLEEWLILHFEYTAKYFVDCKSAIDRLRKHMSDYEKSEKYYKKYNDDLYKKLREKLPVAIANGKKLGEVDFDNIESAKSEMYKLFDFLNIE